jgi:catechol 2,3-dioxygenase-like lactoylglutathione lyase family enzyme
VHLKAKDPRKTARWWVDVFGAKLQQERDMGGALFVPVELSGVTINISSPRPDEVNSMKDGDAGLHYGLEHLGLYTDDLDADLAKLRKHGLQIFVVRETAEVKMAFVETPDKVRVELIQRLK